MSYIPRRREDDTFPGSLWKYIRRFFCTIGILSFISFIISSVTIFHLAGESAKPFSDQILLSYTFTGVLQETGARPSLSHPFTGIAPTTEELIHALNRAIKDPRVKGLIVKIEDAELNTAQIQELRDAIGLFKKSGKFAWIYSDSYGGMSGGMGDYYLASAFDQIWLQPVGILAAGGIAAEVPFLKDFFDKIGVNAEFAHRGVYKSFHETLTMNKMSDAQREMMTGLVGDLYSQITQDIAGSRHIVLPDLEQILKKSPLTDTESLQSKLVDKLGYEDEMVSAAKAQTGIADGEPVDLLHYASRVDNEKINLAATLKQDRKKIALIIGSGEIMPYGGKTEDATAFSGGDAGYIKANALADAFFKATDDKNVAAIVFRIDSPGGSPVASETIRRAMINAKQKGKPVIVSMGGMAASGGYWIASPADKIVAQPGTLTGSIGVFGGKFVLSGLWDKLGVHWEGVAAGDRAQMWSMNKDFSEDEYKRFDNMMENTYQTFLSHVSEDRHMTMEEARAVAEGRVWTGRQAKEKGLVDTLGGLETAMALAKEAAKLPADADIPVERFPQPRSPFVILMSMLMDGSLFRPSIHINAEDLLRSIEGLSAPTIK